MDPDNVSYDVQTGSYVCYICFEPYKNKQSLNKHFSQVHSNSLFNCEFCPKQFKSRKYLSSHVLHVHNDAELTCDFCHGKFKAKKSLKRHIEKFHSGDSIAQSDMVFTCEICYKQFKLKTYLNTHISMVHNNEYFLCDLCKKPFKSKKYLQRHIVCVHNKKTDCVICQKKHKTRKSLQKHMIKEHGLLTCDLCDFAFTEKRYLNAHVASVHKNRRPVISYLVECSICKKKLKSLDSLKHHINNLHTSNAYPCTHCDMIFKSEQYRKNHLKRIERKEKEAKKTNELKPDDLIDTSVSKKPKQDGKFAKESETMPNPLDFVEVKHEIVNMEPKETGELKKNHVIDTSLSLKAELDKNITKVSEIARLLNPMDFVEVKHEIITGETKKTDELKKNHVIDTSLSIKAEPDENITKVSEIARLLNPMDFVEVKHEINTVECKKSDKRKKPDHFIDTSLCIKSEPDENISKISERLLNPLDFVQVKHEVVSDEES